MAKYKIGATDGGDAGIDLSWRNKMNTVDGAILITKHITPEFVQAVSELDNVIVHVTCTGYGGTVVEPNVPEVRQQYEAALTLPRKDRVVIRIDPIIPTDKGIDRVRGVFKLFMDAGFNRYRVSIIDMYPHVRERFKKAGLPSPYGDLFGPNYEQISKVRDLLREAKSYWLNTGHNAADLRIEACAESLLGEAIHCGCVSEYDLQLLGLIGQGETVDDAGYQRPNCLCYSGKVELLTGRKPCPHQCLYCFWK